MEVGFPKKRNVLPKMLKKRVEYTKFASSYSKESGAGILVATDARNCEFPSGKLVCGVGTKKYYLPYAPDEVLNDLPESLGEALKFFAFRFESNGKKKDVLMMETSVNSLYVYDESVKDLKIIDSKASGWNATPFYDESGNTRIFVTTEMGGYTYDPIKAKGTWVMYGTGIAGSAYYHERIFLGYDSTVRYSEPMGYSDFPSSTDGGGTIKLSSEAGAIVGIKNLGEKLFVFFERGIVRLDAAGKGRDFVVENLPYVGSKIFSSSICRYENAIYFICSDGIMRFDGTKIEEVGRLLGVRPKSGTLCHPAFFQGKLYLTYTDKDGNLRSVFFELDNEENCGEIFCAHGLSYSQGEAFCSVNRVMSVLDEQGKLPTGEEYRFKAEGLEFGDKRRKILRSVEIFGSGSCKLTVAGENGSQTESLSLDDGGKMKLALKGKRFSLTIKPVKGCVVERILFDVEFYTGGVK